MAIGSGNLSVGGWHLNAETWTIAAADRERCLRLIFDAAEWLRRVVELCTISPPAADAIGRTAAALDALSGGELVDTGHRLVDTLDAPIVDQLPDTSVEHLRLYAPFHDERAEAIQELVVRLAPARVTLAVQSDHRTVVQPNAIARLIEDLGISLEVVEDRHRSYRHGKLVEAIDYDGACWTLTGSPNLPAAALLKPVAGGGNVELPERTMRRLSDEPRGNSQGPVEILTDARLADRWLSGIRQLAAARASIALPAAGGTDSPIGESKAATSTPRLDTDPEDWLRYSDDAKTRLGTAMFHFSLGGFPAIAAASTSYTGDLLQPTDLLSDERTAGLDEDDANTINDDIDPSTGQDAETGASSNAEDESDPNEDSDENEERCFAELPANRTEAGKRAYERML
ncbi:hypothetical protein [Micromonospora sp. NPDC047187]|uniref:hypothetical protein n=1 Tax=Micromonospora sp. NPDC047187 TaxID=3155262 RepID=UPI00340E8EF6